MTKLPPRGVPPKPIIPPKPSPPPVIRPPLPPGPIVITPGGPPKPPEPLPPQYLPGNWSDGWAVVRQTGGSLLVTLSSGMTAPFDIRHAGEQAASIVNQFLGVVGLAARATTIPPWPPAMASLSKAQTVRAIGEFMGEVTLADLAAQIQVLILNSEQVNTRLAAIEEHLAGAETEQPPTPPVSTDVTFWDMFMSAPNPDPETWQPEAFTVYDRSRVLMQWRAQYSPKGVRVYQDVERQMSLIRHIYADPTDPVTVAFLEEGHTIESAVYAILSGRVDEIVGSVVFGTRQKDAVIRLGKHDAEWMFQRDIAGAVAGGNAGQGGA